ncbi:hypothetical protein JXM67_09660 [candidate division WOR-3 bacterium]|nr:hypothetical protein [candidate division WOR-3 bacterium]
METDKNVLTWKDVVRGALLELGGQGHLSEINKKIEGHPKTKTNPTWRDTIRRVVRQYKIFEPIPPEKSGVYKLVEESELEVKQQSFSDEPEIDHGIAQGMLVALGRIYGYETYAPKTDQTIRTFQGKPLSEFVSVGDCTNIFRGSNLSQIRQIDSLWFDEDDDGLFPTYAFEVEHTTKVKSGLDRLLKIPKRYATGFFIIGPSKKEKDLFAWYLNQTPFRQFARRFIFKTYHELEELYNTALTHDTYRENFGVTERWKL